MEKPKIRALETFLIEHKGQKLVCLRDPTGVAPEPVVIGLGAYFLVAIFDGTNTLLDIQAAFARRFGDVIPSERLRELVGVLDRTFLLDSPAYAERMRLVRETFARSPQRPAALAGLCYEADPANLRAEITAYFEKPNGPGTPNGVRADGALSGLIAPHIDPRRGGPAYAHAYAEVMAASERPELIIILGTAHSGRGPELFTATPKDYATPLGVVRTDRDFISRIGSRYGAGDLFADELLHRNEHSIEFQALFLAYALGVEGYRIVPILVSSFHEMVARGVAPVGERRVGAFLEALAAELAAERRRVLVVAGVDFSHIGRKFGDSFGVDDDVARDLRRADLELIEYVKRGDATGFFAAIAKDRDRRRICGLAPMYMQLQLLQGHQARLLKYDIALEPQTESAVSFASLAIA